MGKNPLIKTKQRFFHTGFAREGANLSDIIERMICYG